MIAKLMTIKQAAEAIGVPVGSLRSAAEEHGYLIRIGSAVRLSSEDIPRLIDACRVEKRKPPTPLAEVPAHSKPSRDAIFVGFTPGALALAESKRSRKAESRAKLATSRHKARRDASDK